MQKQIEEENQKKKNEQIEEIKETVITEEIDYEKWPENKKRNFRKGIKSLVGQVKDIQDKNKLEFLQSLRDILNSRIKGKSRSHDKVKQNSQEENIHFSRPISKGESAHTISDKIEKVYGQFTILNKLSQQKQKDLTVFQEYLEYLIKQRQKWAFNQMFFQKPKIKHKIIHAKVDLLKRPIVIEEFTENYKQFINQENNGNNYLNSSSFQGNSPMNSFIRYNNLEQIGLNQGQNVNFSVISPGQGQKYQMTENC